jgi:hypothetical protein
MLLSRPAVALLREPLEELRVEVRRPDAPREDEAREVELREDEVREEDLGEDGRAAEARVEPPRFEPPRLLELFLLLPRLAAISLSFASLDACTISPLAARTRR